MVYQLISATPSPFARINRILMLEKGIPFELQNEIPWHPEETKTTPYNPLQKLPILLKAEDPNFEPVYDSAFIQLWLLEKHKDQAPLLLTGDTDLDFKAKQLQVLSEGVMDAFVLEFFEIAKPDTKKSQAWLERQQRKVDGGLKAFDELVKNKKGEYLIGDGKTYTIADIAVVCATSQVDFGGIRPQWKETYPDLAKWWAEMDAREHYASTRPIMFDIKTDSVIA